jgi:tRNA threonylcarbamoyladenosine biosynthesis protein TsaB
VTIEAPCLCLSADLAGVVRGESMTQLRRTGDIGTLPLLAAALLGTERPVLVAVVVGPGSFTGLRAALALAHGVALGAGCELVGVTVGEALAEALPHLGQRDLWVAIDSRRERLFLERDGVLEAFAPKDLPMPQVGVALAGDASRIAAAWLAARGADVMLTDAATPSARHIARAAARRLAGGLPPRAVQPLYVDAPETRSPNLPTRAPPT